MKRALTIGLCALFAGCGADLGVSRDSNGNLPSDTSTAGNGTGTGTNGNGTGTGTNGNGTNGNGTTTNNNPSGTALQANAAKLVGTYSVTTQFNLVAALPADIAKPLQLVLDLASDPGQAIFNQLANIDSLKILAEIAKQVGLEKDFVTTVDKFINGETGGETGFAEYISGIAKDIETALRGVQAHHVFVISSPDMTGSVVISDTIDQLIYTYGGNTYTYKYSGKSMTTGKVVGQQLTIAAHAYDRPLQVGTFVLGILDDVALPELLGVNSFGAFLSQDTISNCPTIGTEVASAIGQTPVPELFHCADNELSGCIGPDVYEAGCRDVFKFVGDYLEGMLRDSMNTDSSQALSDPTKRTNMTQGVCTGSNEHPTAGKTSDDTLSAGTWTLNVAVGKLGELTLPGTFTGTLGAATTPAKTPTTTGGR